MIIHVKKGYILLLIVILLLLGLAGFLYYKEETKAYLPFFMNANIYSSNYGIENNYWNSYYFQPITQSIEENSDGIILKVKYRNSENKWLKANVLLYSNEKYHIKDVLAFQSEDESLQSFSKSEKLIDSLDKAKKLIPLNKQVLITMWQTYPNAGNRTTEVCKKVLDSSTIDLCNISDVIDNNFHNQLSFWNEEDMKGQYIIPNFIAITPVNEK